MTAHQIVARARNLPRVSEAALRLVPLLDESSERFEEAAALIKADSFLTVKLLRACNSSAFGFAERIASVDQALLLLGFAEVRRLTLSLGFGNAMKVPLPGYCLSENAMWRHSFMTATAAEAIVNSGLSRDVDASVVFTAGLLHDIGKLVMADVINAEVRDSIQKHMTGEGLGSAHAEREVLGTDHAEVGSCLLHIWRLPEVIVEAAANHHRPILKPTPQVSAIIHLANRIAHLADSETAGYQFQANEEVVQAFELNNTEQAELIETVRGAADRARQLQTIV
jgi:putative nucleotidyltransferase with HDIG domain